ncbi:MAG: enoyl-CoA hydratase/isomerase family protein [Alphaproteobacteria bacterium]|nr:enoyl-CoA hydratase/isomerase family protein [Alphaproteobacteria bacterium]
MVKINEVGTLEQDGDVAVLTIDSPPVNALSGPVRAALHDGMLQALKSDAKGIVLICGGRTFIAGADITGFGKANTGPGLNEVFDALENSTKPVVAAIHGTALGGGLEVALTCSYRVAVPSAKTGLPEVKLGLLPGAGGTQRLPRLVGAEKALGFMTTGDQISAADSLKLGIVDELVPENDLRGGAIAFIRKKLAAGEKPPRVRDRDEKIAEDRKDPGLFDRFRKANARQFRGQLAPEMIIQCVEAAVNQPFDDGIKTEQRLFGKVIVSPESAAMRYMFFAERQANKIPDVPADTPTRPIKKVGVLGAGTMGGGIAMNFANAGIPVTIVEAKQENLDKGLATIRRNYENTAKKGRITAADVEKRMGLLKGSLDMNDFADADMIIEAVFENMDIKKDVFAKLDKIAKKGAILATNTSYLDVNEIAAATSRPEDVIGTHFFSPANVMRLCEIVRGDKTAKDVINTTMKVAKTINKVGVLVGVCHGFVGNRMLAQRQIQANAILNEGAMPWDIDRVLYDYGFPMGPFAMSDLAGLDVGWFKEKSTSSTIREVMCETGRLGQKNGKGFYDYDENRVAKPSPVTEKIIKEFAAKAGKNLRDISDEEILERTLYPMINEGAKILEEGKALRASDIDTIWITGYGFPLYRGGPMFYADQIGLAKIVERLKHYEKQMGAFFKPSALLEKLAAEGKKFTS